MKRSTSTPGGPSRVRAGSAGSSRYAPQPLGGVARADEHAARGVRPRRGRAGRSAPGTGRPCTRGRTRAPSPRTGCRCRPVRGRARAGRARGGWRSATSACAPRHLGDGGGVARDVVLELGVRELGVRCAPRRRRSGRARRPGAGRRCRAGRPSRAAARADLELEAARVPAARGVHPVERQRRAVLAEQVDLMARAHERGRERGVVDVRSRPLQQIPMEDHHAHGRAAYAAAAGKVPRHGPEVPVAHALDRARDRHGGRARARLSRPRHRRAASRWSGKLLPLHPSTSSLPWAVENLRFCNWCDQMAQKDLNDCPTCGRRMAALPPR